MRLLTSRGPGPTTLGPRFSSHCPARTQRSRLQASLTGTWVKDAAASESADSTCDLFELNFVVRNALVFVRTMQIFDEPEHFTTRLKALVLDIDERYHKSGSPAQYNRRDLRPGKLTGRYQLTAEGHPSIVAEWDDPVKGRSEDVFVLSDDGNVLTQTTTYFRHSNGKSTRYRTVHRREVSADDDGW